MTTPAQVQLQRTSPTRWRVILENPPINVMGREFVLRFREIVTAIETDDQLKVVTFESPVEGYNEASLPADVEIAAGWDACMASLGRPASQAGIKALIEQGFHAPGDVENRLGFYLGQLSTQNAR